MMTRGLWMVTLLGTAMLVAATGASAQDDPSYGIPDPSPVSKGAWETAYFTAGDALMTYRNIENNAVEGAESAVEGDPSVPFDNADGIFDNATDFGTRSVERTHAFATLVQDWTFNEARGKLDESNFTVDRIFESATQHTASTVEFARLVAAAICRDTVLSEDPTQCQEDSVISDLLGNGEESGEDASGIVDHLSEQAQAFVDHLRDQVEFLLCGGPCDE